MPEQEAQNKASEWRRPSLRAGCHCGGRCVREQPKSGSGPIGRRFNPNGGLGEHHGAQRPSVTQNVVPTPHLDLPRRGHSSRTRYWDVRTSDGEVRSVRIWSRSLWGAARPGDGLIKREGELHPDLIARR